jgi:L-threonylcarbamoyladenylate synthase
VTRVFPPQAIAEAAALLRAGELVAFPTETVYGLGGDATNDQAVAAIFAAKDRPRFNPLIVHVPDLDTAQSLAAFDRRAERIAQRFWPGPLSLVLPRRKDCRVSFLASAGLDTLALRIPAHPLALQLLQAAERPLAAPSANRSGRVSPTRAEHVMAELDGRISAVLHGGACQVGIESSVLDLSEEQPVLLRSGGIPREELEVLLGSIAQPDAASERRSPGMLQSHYAPQRALRLNAREAYPGEALLAFGPNPPKGFAEVRSLSESGDLAEAAARLFALLRALDRPGITAIAVMPIPEHGLGAAINDRLRRAAAPR